MRFATAVLATLGIVGSGLVYQSGVDVPNAWAAVTSSGLVMNLDATNTSSYPGSGTTWTDLTGSGRNATLVGSGTTYDAATRSIKFTNSGNGVNYASLAGNFNDFSGGVTIDFEGNFGSNADAFERIIDLAPGFDPNISDTILVGRRGTGNDIFIDVRKNNVSFGHGYVALTAADMSATNRWTITLGTDQGGLKFYKNGVAQTVLSTGTAPSLWTNPTNATRSANWLGRSNWNDQGFEGSIRYIRLYNRALSPSEVTANVTNTVTFNANGGSGSMSTQTASAPTALTSNTFTRTDYAFAGWNTAANGTGQSFNNASTFYFTNDVTLYAQWTPVVPSGGTPSITGTVQVGQTLTANPGTWTSGTTPTYAYQWQESVNGSTWTNISGATTSTFTLTSSQAAEYVRVQVVATNTAGSSSTVSSAATALVLSANTVASTAGTNNPVTDLIAAVPNDSNWYIATIVTSNLANGKLKWSSNPANLTGVFGHDASGLSYLPSQTSLTEPANWATGGYPILTFRGTGANIRTALGSLTYTSSSVQTDSLRIYVNTGSSSTGYVGNYLPIWDNGRLTFHYYTFQTQTARSAPDTNTFLQGTTLLDGVSSPNKWHLFTPRYWSEDNRGWVLAGAAGSTNGRNVLLGGFSDNGSTNWYYPANTDGYSTSTIFSSGTTGQNGLYAAWINQDLGSSGDRAIEYWCNSCTISGGSISGTFGWDDIPRTTTIGAYIAETWSTTPLAIGTSNTAVQTVRTSTPAAAPTGLTVTANSKTSVTLGWTAPGSTGSDSITDYSVQYSTDNSTWTTWSKSPSLSTSATITGLTAGVAYWFRVAAITTITGAYSSAISSAMTDTGTTTTLGGYSIPTNLTGTIRVLLWTSNASGKLSLGSATNIDGGIRNTANYPTPTHTRPSTDTTRPRY